MKLNGVSGTLYNLSVFFFSEINIYQFTISKTTFNTPYLTGSIYSKFGTKILHDILFIFESRYL